VTGVQTCALPIYFVHKYQWVSEEGKQKAPVPIGLHFPYSSVPEWYKLFLDGGHINASLSSLLPNEQAFLKSYDMKSIVIIPLFLHDQFWGFFSVDDCCDESAFSDGEIDILRSASLMMASAVNRHEQDAKIRKADETALAESKAIMDNMDLMITVCDLDYNLLYINKTLVERNNLDRDACIGRKCYEAIRGLSEPCSFCHMSELVPNKDTFPSVNYDNIWYENMNLWIS
jgi:PAS domain-containing protein